MTTAYSDAMTTQLSRLHARLAAGMPRAGWKVGINVPEVQQQLGLSHALIGWLDGQQLHSAGATLSFAPGQLLHAEPELCLRLGANVEPGSDTAEALAAVDSIAPALEIVDYQRPRGSLSDIVSHAMFHHACVLGEFLPYTKGASLDIASGVRFRVGEREAEAARSDLVPSGVALLVLQVSTLLAEVGEQLLAGDLIMSGSFCARALPLVPGAEVRAQLSQFGSVHCHVAA
jgi:2-oxo-3-hexenedioate decarboxylase